MKKLMLLAVILVNSNWVVAEETWSVAQAKIEENLVLYRFTNEFPEDKLRQAMPWLTVVSWKYDGTENNGLPSKKMYQAMNKLEDGLLTINNSGKLYTYVYSVTGNNLKEWVFHISNREDFMNHFNQALKEHPSYPIEINFFEDPQWSDLSKLQNDFKTAAEKQN